MGLFSRKQANERHQAKDLGVFIEHLGMWGDFFVVSEVVAYIFTYLGEQWKPSSVLAAAVVSMVLTRIMLAFWRKESRGGGDMFALDKMTTLDGWVHAAYLFVCLTVILLFYFGTARVPHLATVLITLGLGIHVSMGTAGLEYMNKGKIGGGNIATVCVSWTALAFGAYHLW